MYANEKNSAQWVIHLQKSIAHNNTTKNAYKEEHSKRYIIILLRIYFMIILLHTPFSTNSITIQQAKSIQPNYKLCFYNKKEHYF